MEGTNMSADAEIAPRVEGGVDFVVKLGGSAITYKSELEKIREQKINSAVRLLCESWRRGLRFIIVHGAGSFGHHHAYKYNVNGGFFTEDPVKNQSVRTGFSKTHQSVVKLNHTLLELIIKENIPAVSVQVCGVWKTAGGEVIQDGVEHIFDLLAAGFLPVLHGDCVLDSKNGCTILSGDTIIETLAKKLKPKRIIFISDVCGIYSNPPKNKGAKLINYFKIKNNDLEQFMNNSTSCTEYDVTGGMSLKLKTARNILAENGNATSVHICKINSVESQILCYMEDLKQDNDCTTIIYEHKT